MNSRFEDAYRSYICQGSVACGPCAVPPPGILSAQANFVALCQSGRCQAVDLRNSKFSECKTSADCELQYGTGCCGGCGNEDLIAVNPRPIFTTRSVVTSSLLACRPLRIA